MNSRESKTPIFVFVPTHTRRYLDLVLAGLARQTRRPEHLVVSCDTDDAAIGKVVESWAPRLNCPVSWVRRPHQGVARLSQVRNNAARYVMETLGCERGRLIQIDGDILCSDSLVHMHGELGAQAEMVFPHRIDVSEAVSKGLDAEAVLAGEQRLEVTPADRHKLAARDRRYWRHLWLRRLRLCPLHKPKLLGCNWSGTLERWRELNGFDELFTGWGYADDEFARRAALAGASCVPACEKIVAFHLYHTTRQPSGAMNSNPNYARFCDRTLPVRAEHGLVNPTPQGVVEATRF